MSPRMVASDEGLVGIVYANGGGHLRVWRHDPPLPHGQFSVGHSVMDDKQVRQLIDLLRQALGEEGSPAELGRLRFIEEQVRGQAQAWRDGVVARALGGEPGPVAIAYRACAQDIEDILSAAGPGPALPPPDHLQAALDHLLAYRDQVRMTAGEPA